MLKASWMICSAVLLMANVGCASKSSPQKVTPPPPPAWMMQAPPDLLTPLNGIIGVSENESKPATK
ncbi:TPA: Rz1 family lipoprotein [Enterobacter sichuanensis]